MFPFISNRPISEIKPMVLLEVLRYAIIAGQAGYNPERDLSMALTVQKRKNYPFVSAEELPHFVRDLEAYTGIGSIITKNAPKIVMLTGVKTQEMGFAIWSEVDLENGIWVILDERMKIRRPHIVSLLI